MSEILPVVDFSYKHYVLTQVASEIIPFSKFYKELNCKNVLEIGSLFGGTFYLLCKLSNLEGKKISIDYPFYGQQEGLKQRRTHENMMTFAKDVHIITGDSHAQDTVEKLKNVLNGEELDFIFIDGDHSYEGVKMDLEMYSPFLKDGGYIGFHDINDTEFHRNANCYVEKLWTELKDYKKIEFNTKSMYMGIGVIQHFKHKKTLNMNVSYEASSGKLHIHNMDFSNLDTIVSIRDRDTKIPIYHTDLPFSDKNNGFFVIPLMNYDFMADKNFSGFLVEFYDKNKNFIDSKDLKIKERSTPVPLMTRNYGPFDCLFINYKQIFYDKIYDFPKLDEVRTVIDVGANVGLFSNYMSYKKEVRVIHAVEPTQKAFSELQNQFYYYNSVIPYKLAIHYSNGKLNMNVNTHSSIFSTFLGNQNSGDSVEEVEVKTLPEFMNSVRLPTVDLIKIDVEGLEYEILNSMSDQEVLRGSNWIIEYHANDDGKAEILQDRFKFLGYQVQNFPDKVPQYINDNIAIQGFFFATK